MVKLLGTRGIPVTPVVLESPEMIGTVERQGSLWKDIAKRVVTSKGLRGGPLKRLMAAEVHQVKNKNSRLCPGTLGTRTFSSHADGRSIRSRHLGRLWHSIREA